MKTLKKWSVIVMIMLATVIGSSSCEEQLVEPEIKSSELSLDGKELFDDSDADDDDPEPPCTDCVHGDVN